MRKVIKTILKPIFDLLVIIGGGVIWLVSLLCDFIDWVLEVDE